MEEVENLLKSIELDKYIVNFKENGITSLDKFSFVTKEFLSQIGINNLRDRNLIIYFIKNDGKFES